MKKNGFFNKLHSLRGEKKGVAAIEFALVVPFIIVLLLGSVDAVFALTAKRKVALATHSVADLAAREQFLPDDELSAIAALGRLIMTPFNVTDSTIAISGLVVLDDGQNAVVVWSQAFTAPGAGTAVLDEGATEDEEGGASGRGEALTAEG